MKKPKKIFLIILIVIISLIIILFLIRLISPREIDDVSPAMPCEKDQKYLEKADILWVIPKFKNQSISENPEWCEYILSLNKTLGMHGIKHTYREFRRENISQEELDQGILEFEGCFGYRPEIFKFPQLRFNKENKKLLKQNDLKIRTKFSQFTHKVYHCDDSGITNPKFTDIFRGVMANKYADIL